MNSIASFAELVAIMARLRAPDGCPWDREQTHATLKGPAVSKLRKVQSVRKHWLTGARLLRGHYRKAAQDKLDEVHCYLRTA